MKNLVKLVFVLIVFSINTVQAQWYEIGQIEGIEDGSRAGWSVSVNSDGSVVAYGEVTNSNNGSDAGQVKIYGKTNDNWNQVGQAIQGEQAGGNFGDAVSLNAEGTIVAVGSPFNEENGVNAGQVSVFENVNGNWVQMGQNINGESAFNNSGRTVSLNASGTILAIGSHYNSNNGTQSGHVRVFEYTNGSWVQLGLDINGESQFDESGWSVSLSDDGTIVAIGAKYNDANGYDKGQVRVYNYQNGSWTQIGEDIDGEADNDLFGFSVSINSNGSIVVIGGIHNEANGSLAGHVRVFEYTNGSWTQMGDDIDGEEGENFGYSVSISDDGLTVVIGAINGDGQEVNSGLARVYNFNNGNWSQMGGTIEGEVTGVYFGRSVSMNSDATSIVIGIPSSGANNSLSGKVKIFGNEPLDISDISKQELIIYPNPTNYLINIKTLSKNYELFIYDITGKLIFNKEVLNNNGLQQINISNFVNGIYILKIKENQNIFKTKIIKQ